MEFLTEKKNDLKGKVSRLYQSYGQLCATNPLPMIISSVILVVLCSLPLLSHPVFERTATFLFGRIQIGKYKTNVSLPSETFIHKNDIAIQQVNIRLTVNVSENEVDKSLDTWMVFQKSLDKAGIRDVNKFCKRSNWWMRNCLHVSRKSFYKSPQTRLIYPRGRFYKDLRKWFPKRSCLFVTPTAILGIKSRQFADLPEPFKELLLGYPLKESGLSSPMKFVESHQFQFTISFFMKDYSNSFSVSMGDHFKRKQNTSVTMETTKTHRVEYMSMDDESHTEFIILIVIYLLVFVYLLFSVGRSDMLKSRWGLAFSAVMTIIMSMMMALGICASLDLLPNTFTIIEIFPYVVIVIGLENVMIITKSVVSTPPDIDVTARVGKAMGKEGWYITKNLCAELAILGGGYYTHIPSLQEFCIFAFVGVLSDFFFQMVFFAPILAVDIRRAEICHLEQITIGQQFAVGFNLMQKTALTLVPPSPPKTKWSEFVDFWVKRRMFQKAMMTAVLAYTIYAVYHKVENANYTPKQQHQDVHDTVENRATPHLQRETLSPLTNPNSIPNQFAGVNRNQKTFTSSSEGSGNDEHFLESSTGSGSPSWKFLSKQHWPELLTFYHIRFNEKALVVLPTIDVTMSIHLNETDRSSSFKFTKTSQLEDALLILSLAACIIGLIYITVLVISCVSRRKRKPSVIFDDDTFQVERFVLKGHRHAIEYVVADKPYVVAACITGSIRVWDMKSSECVMQIQPNQRSCDELNPLANSTVRRRGFTSEHLSDISPSMEPINSIWCLDCKHNMIAVGFSSGSLEVYNICGKRLIAAIKEESGVIAVKIASRNTVVLGRLNGLVDIIELRRNQLDSVEDIESGEASSPGRNDSFGCQMKHRITQIGPLEHLAVFAGRFLCSANDMIRVYDIDDANLVTPLNSNENEITAFHQIRENPSLSVAVGYNDGSITLFNTVGEEPNVYRIHDSSIVSICSCSKYFASLDCDNNILIWSPDEQGQHVEVQDVPADPACLHFLDACTLCVISQSCISLFDATTGCLLHTVNSTEENISLPNSNLICFPRQNSIIMAVNRSVYSVTFPKLSKSFVAQANN